MDVLLITTIALVILALIFDFSNGFHDAANSVATVVATRALPAKWAPAFSAFFNFIAFFVVGTAVANTVAKTVSADYIGVAVIFAAIFSALIWNYVTWYIGMPSSSSHAIIGGLVGAGLSVGGFAAVSWGGVEKAAIGIVASPLVAFSVAAIAFYLIYLIQRWFKIHNDSKIFKGLQLVSAAAFSFGHGANDAQKTMGVIAALLLGAGFTTMSDGNVMVPVWVGFAAYAAIAIGTLWGGWKIIDTMAIKITKITANTGLAANIGAATAIFGATSIGMPISTTQAAASSIVGSGVASRNKTDWTVVKKMLIAWITTIPVTAIMAFVIFKITQLPEYLSWFILPAMLTGFAYWAVGAMKKSIKSKDIEKELEDA